MDTKKSIDPFAGYFSFYPDRTGRDGKRFSGVLQQIGSTASCFELYEYIKGLRTYPELKERTKAYRQTRSKQWTTEEERQAITAEAKAIKETLPTFIATGEYKYIKADKRKPGESAQQIETTSNLICIDFDHITDTAAAWQRIINDELVQPVLVFHSVSGKGIKCILPFPKYDKAKWLYYCRAIAEHYQDITATDETTGEQTAALDFGNAKDPIHKNSICCDPGAYYNETADPRQRQFNAEPFAAAIAYIEQRAAEIKAAEPKQEPRPAAQPTAPITAPDGRERTTEEKAAYSLKAATWYAETLKAKAIDITKDLETWHVIGFALTDGTLSDQDAETIFDKVSSANYPNYTAEETHKHFLICKRGRNNAVNFGTFIHRAAEAIGETYEHYLQRTKPTKQATPTTPPKQSTLDTLDTIATPTTQATMDKPQPTMQTTFRQTTLADITAAETAARATPQIQTPFVFNGKPLTLRSNALTLIAAKSSHGKTRLLENMAYHTATKDPTPGATILFTLEEPKRNIFTHLAAIHAYTTDNRCTIDEIDNALQQDCNGEQANASHRQALQDFDKALQTHQLFIFDDTDTPTSHPENKWSYRAVQAICDDMRDFARQAKIKAIYIDHLQMLQYFGKGTETHKNERIELMLDSLESLAKELHIPITITAQMTRSTYNGLNMTGSNIAESADTERSADTILLLWNSTYPFTNQYGEPSKEDTDNPNPELLKIGYRYTGENDEQLLLADLYKRRGGKRGTRTTFAYHAPFGYIEQLQHDQAAEHDQSARKQEPTATRKKSTKTLYEEMEE